MFPNHPSLVAELLHDTDCSARRKYDTARALKEDVSARIQKAFDTRSDADICALFAEERRATEAVRECQFDLDVVHHALNISRSSESACMSILVLLQGRSVGTLIVCLAIVSWCMFISKSLLRPDCVSNAMRVC